MPIPLIISCDVDDPVRLSGWFRPKYDGLTPADAVVVRVASTAGVTVINVTPVADEPGPESTVERPRMLWEAIYTPTVPGSHKVTVKATAEDGPAGVDQGEIRAAALLVQGA